MKPICKGRRTEENCAVQRTTLSGSTISKGLQVMKTPNRKPKPFSYTNQRSASKSVSSADQRSTTIEPAREREDAAPNQDNAPESLDSKDSPSFIDTPQTPAPRLPLADLAGRTDGPSAEG